MLVSFFINPRIDEFVNIALGESLFSRVTGSFVQKEPKFFQKIAQFGAKKLPQMPKLLGSLAF